MSAHIRLATALDGEAVAAISFETTLPDRVEMARRIDETLPSYPWLVCEVGGHTAVAPLSVNEFTAVGYRGVFESTRRICRPREALKTLSHDVRDMNVASRINGEIVAHQELAVLVTVASEPLGNVT